MLMQKRSCKHSLDKEEVIKVLSEEAQAGKVDADIVDVLMKTTMRSKPMLGSYAIGRPL